MTGAEFVELAKRCLRVETEVEVELEYRYSENRQVVVTVRLVADPGDGTPPVVISESTSEALLPIPQECRCQGDCE